MLAYEAVAPSAEILRAREQRRRMCERLTAYPTRLSLRESVPVRLSYATILRDKVRYRDGRPDASRTPS